MDMFSKKPSSQETLTKDTENEELPHPVQPTPAPVVRKEKHSRAFSFVSVLFLLAILGVGVMAYLWYDQKSTVESMQAEVDAAETTVTNLRSQLGKANDTAGSDGSVSSQPTPASDDEMIKAAATVYRHALKSTADAKFVFSSIKTNSPFAKASMAVEGENGGFACWLKKADGTWVVMFCGQQLPEQAVLDTWGMPANTLQ